MSQSDAGNSALQRGLILQEQGRYREAETFFREALGAEPEDAINLFLLASCLFQQDRCAEAQSTIEQAIRLDPQHPNFHSLQSLIFSDQKKYPQAVVAAERSLQIDPQCLEGHVAMGQAQIGLEAWAKVEEAARQGLAIDPTDSRPANQLALALRLQNKMAENAAQIQGMLQRDPENAGTHISAGWSALQGNQHRLAETHFREALRLRPGLESGRIGLLESFKARSPFYRAYLQYCFFMQRLQEKSRWALIIGLAVAMRLSRFLFATSAPGLYWTIFLLYLTLVFWTHIAPAVGNLIVSLDRTARLALRPGERWMGWLGGGFFLGGLALLAAGLALHQSPCQMAGITAVAAAFPLRYAVGNDSIAGRWVFGITASITLASGSCVLLLPLTHSSLSASLGPLGISGVLLSLMVTTWLATIQRLRQ